MFAGPEGFIQQLKLNLLSLLSHLCVAARPECYISEEWGLFLRFPSSLMCVDWKETHIRKAHACAFVDI